MLVHFCLHITVQFPSNPCFIRQNTCFLLRYISSVFLRLPPLVFSVHVYGKCARGNRKREGGRGHAGGKTVRTCAREIILGRNLLRQSEALCQVPVWTPVVQVTGEAISADDSWVRPHNRNCGSAIVIATYMWNGFIHFHCHESTQICEYAQGILS